MRRRSPARQIATALVAASLSLALLACAADKVFVTSRQDGNARFEDYLDYRWLSRRERRPAAWIDRYPALASMVEAAVDLELSYKGFRRRDAGRVDFLVSVHTEVEDVAIVSSGRFRGWSHGYDQFRVTSTRNVSYIDREAQGTLAIRIVDAATDRVVFEASAAGVVRESDGLERRLQKVAEMMLVGFPPDG